MKYLVMIWSNPASRAAWDALSDAERMANGRAHLAVTDALAASGELVVSEGLTEPQLGKGVAVRDGRTIVSDGPYAEAKEYLAGFYLVDCASEERALEVAAGLPDAVHGGVEVRPVLDLSFLDV